MSERPYYRGGRIGMVLDLLLALSFPVAMTIWLVLLCSAVSGS